MRTLETSESGQTGLRISSFGGSDQVHWGYRHGEFYPRYLPWKPPYDPIH